MASALVAEHPVLDVGFCHSVALGMHLVAASSRIVRMSILSVPASLKIASRSYAFITSTCCISMVLSLLVSIDPLEYFTVPQHPQEIIDIKEFDIS